MNKKKIGLGMMIAGGALTLAGAILVKKSANDVCKEDELLKEMIEDEIPYKIEPEMTNTVEVETIKATPVEWQPTEENTVEACVSTSTYNPMATPVSMSQQDIESMGNTF